MKLQSKCCSEVAAFLRSCAEMVLNGGDVLRQVTVFGVAVRGDEER